MLFLFPGPETSESWLTFIGRMKVLVQLAWLRVALQGVALELRKGHFNEKRFQDRHESGTVVMEWKQDTGVSTRVSGRAASTAACAACDMLAHVWGNRTRAPIESIHRRRGP